MTKDVSFDSLVGERVLDGVDRLTESVKKSYGDRYEQCEVLRFRLDGITYMAIQDPSDGYRSCLGAFRIDETEVKNTFPPARVLVRKLIDRYAGGPEADLLEMTCVATGKQILVVGTDHADDYYPSFVADFQPAHLPCNQPARPEGWGNW